MAENRSITQNFKELKVLAANIRIDLMSTA